MFSKQNESRLESRIDGLPEKSPPTPSHSGLNTGRKNSVYCINSMYCNNVLPCAILLCPPVHASMSACANMTKVRAYENLLQRARGLRTVKSCIEAMLVTVLE